MEERLEFFAWIASEPEAGVVIPASGGCRKVRWSRPGMGKQGGARVIYFTHMDAGELGMLQEWEQGRRAPSGAAQALIRIARKHPEVVREALA